VEHLAWGLDAKRIPVIKLEQQEMESEPGRLLSARSARRAASAETTSRQLSSDEVFQKELDAIVWFKTAEAINKTSSTSESIDNLMQDVRRQRTLAEVTTTLHVDEFQVAEKPLSIQPEFLRILPASSPATACENNAAKQLAPAAAADDDNNPSLDEEEQHGHGASASCKVTAVEMQTAVAPVFGSEFFVLPELPAKQQQQQQHEQQQQSERPASRRRCERSATVAAAATEQVEEPAPLLQPRRQTLLERFGYGVRAIPSDASDDAVSRKTSAEEPKKSTHNTGFLELKAGDNDLLERLASRKKSLKRASTTTTSSKNSLS
jgi:hypothetical protein